MSDSSLDKIKDMAICEHTKCFLDNRGWTDVGMLTPDCVNLFVDDLSKEQFVELCVELNKIRAAEFWDSKNINVLT